MKNFYLTALAAIATVAVVIFAALPSVYAQNSNSQEYARQRFVLVAAQVNVFSPEMGGRNETQYVMLKMDTLTGKSWMLQLDVAGGNEPKLRRSAWRELGFRGQ